MGEEAGAEIIIFTIPPFGLSGNDEAKRVEINNNLKALAEEKGYKFFDFAAVLCNPNSPAYSVYGDHPNQYGCKLVADAFMEAGILSPIN